MSDFSQQSAEPILDIALALEICIYHCNYAGSEKNAYADCCAGGRASSLLFMLLGRSVVSVASKSVRTGCLSVQLCLEPHGRCHLCMWHRSCMTALGMSAVYWAAEHVGATVLHGQHLRSEALQTSLSRHATSCACHGLRNVQTTQLEACDTAVAAKVFCLRSNARSPCNHMRRMQ